MSTSAPPETPTAEPISDFDRWFELTKRGSTVGREIRGGLVTFFTMAYIIVLNPIIIGTVPDVNGNLINGLPITADGAVPASMAAVAAGTALIAGLLSILMGGWGRFPIALATGLGLNAFVAYTIAQRMSWPSAMGLVFWEGLLITILVLTGFRKAVLNAVPRAIRSAISVGIGLFIAFIGLADARIITQGAGTPVTLGQGGFLNSWPVAIFIIGLFLLIALYVRRVRGAILIAIIVATALAIAVQAVLNLPAATEDPSGWALNVPQFLGWAPPDLSLFAVPFLKPVEFFFGSFISAGSFAALLGVLLLIFSLLLADFFDTMGTIVAVGAEGNLLGEDGNPPHTEEILLIDSIGAMAGGLGNVSSNTSYIESAAGVGDGARTGIASLATGAAFILCLVLAPFVNMVPSEAAAPALFFVGFLMMSQVVHISWDDPEEAIPAFMALALMPFTYSITVGIGAGFVTYVFVKVVRGKVKEIHPLLWVVAVAFLIYFAQGALFGALG